MSPKQYDVSARGGKLTHAVSLDAADERGTREALKLAKSRQTATHPVTIVLETFPGAGSGADAEERFAVQLNGATIGHLTEAETAEYGQLRRILASDCEVATIARIRLRGGNDASNLDVTISLRDADDVVAVNTAPADPWVLIPSGNIIQVVKEDPHAEYLDSFLPDSGRCQILATLHPVELGVRKKYAGVEVRLDGVRVGELSKAMGEKVRPAVEHYEALGLVAVARAFITADKRGPQVTLECARADELSDDDLEPELSPLPRLTRYHADPAFYAAPSTRARGTSNPFASRPKASSPSTGTRKPGAPIPTPTRSSKGIPEPRKSSTQTSADALAAFTSPGTNPFPTPQTNSFRSPRANTSPAPRITPITSTKAKNTTVQPTILRRPRHQPPTSSTVLLWAGVVVGVFLLMESLIPGDTDSSLVSTVGGALMGIALIAACGWPLHLRTSDQKNMDEWTRNEEERVHLAGMLTSEDSVVLAGMQPTLPPEPRNRRWNVVGPTVGALGIAGMTMVGSGAPPPEVNEASVTSTVTESRTVTESVTVSSSTSSSTSSSSSSSSSSTPTEEPEVAADTDYDMVDDPTTREPVAPAPARPSRTYTPQYTPAPAPAVEPAPSGGGGVYYANCSQARAAGAAPLYVGSPGYRPGLDRDKDGVACE